MSLRGVLRGLLRPLAGAAALGAGACALWPGASRPRDVIVLVWDTVRADHLSLHGYRRPTTPTLDAFARESVVFEQARSPGIWTLPSHATLFTGLWPETHGAGERWMWLDDHHVTLAEHFSAQGYGTLSAAANALLCPETNLVQGFDTVATTYQGRFAQVARAATAAKLLPDDVSNELSPRWRPPEHGATNAEWGRAVYKDAAPQMAERLLAWLDQPVNQVRPTLAFLNWMEAHTPRVPSLASRRAVLADDPELLDLGLRTDAAHIRLHFYNFGKQDYTERELEAIRGVYDAALRDLDAALALLLDGLRARGRLDDTVIVLTSDHGENLGDHHLFNHRLALWDTLAHVPLVVHAPGLSPGRVRAPVSTADLFPTVARLAGVPVPATDAGDWFDAPSAAVTTLLRPLRKEIATVTAVHPDVLADAWLRSGHAIAQGGARQLEWSTGLVERYDLEVDPGELAPLPADPALHAALEAWRAKVRPYDESLRGPRDQPAHVRAGQEDLAEQLQALGYTADEGDEPPPPAPAP